MSSADSNNPLSDSLMQEEVAKMVMHLQDNDSCTSHQVIYSSVFLFWFLYNLLLF